MTNRIRRRSTKRRQRRLSKRLGKRRLSKRRLSKRRLSKRRVRRGGKPKENFLGNLSPDLIRHIVGVEENDPKDLVNLSSASKGINTALVQEREKARADNILAKKKAILEGLEIPMDATTVDLSEKIGGWKSQKELDTIFQALQLLPNLQNLDLSSNELSVMPSSLGNLRNLQELYLNHNGWLRASSLPSSLGNLSNLQHLSLMDNALTALPEGLFSEGNLSNLQTLNLGSNELKALPESLGNLRKLQHLNLNNNELTAIPEWIGNLPNLQKLSLFNNQLTQPDQNPVVVALKKRDVYVEVDYVDDY